MKSLYIYNPSDDNEVNIIKRVTKELREYTTLVSLEELPDILKCLVRETPALILADEHLQGRKLIEVEDASLLVTATIVKRQEDDENAIHNSGSHRLDSFILNEKANVIDHYTMELIEEGLL